MPNIKSEMPNAQVCYKITDFLEDQVMLSGFASGGLSEVPRAHYRSASLAVTLAQEMGHFGFRPEVCPTFVLNPDSPPTP